MEYIYAALLLHNSDKEITEDGITAILEAAGVKADKGRVKALISALSGVDIEEAMAQAQPAYAPAAVAAPVVAPAAQATAPAPKTAEAEKEEKTEEEEEEAEEKGMEGLSALFG